MTGHKPGRLRVSDALADSGVIAILRGASGTYLYDACSQLIERGVRCLEITTNTPGAFGTLARLRGDWGDRVELGVGTVLTCDHVDSAADSGGTFVVAPNVDIEVGERAAARGLGWFPGAMTPSEIVQAWNAGATAVKIFPAASVGGPDFLRQVRGPLNSIPMIPTGGVAIGHIVDYLRAGAVAVGLGGPLIGNVLDSGDLASLGERAGEALRAVAEERGT